MGGTLLPELQPWLMTTCRNGRGSRSCGRRREPRRTEYPINHGPQQMQRDSPVHRLSRLLHATGRQSVRQLSVNRRLGGLPAAGDAAGHRAALRLRRCDPGGNAPLSSSPLGSLTTAVYSDRCGIGRHQRIHFRQIHRWTGAPVDRGYSVMTWTTSAPSS